MSIIRNNSMDNIALKNWRWITFLDNLIEQISIFDIEAIEIPNRFLYKKSVTRSSKNQMTITTSTWACKFNKIRQVRAACIEGGGSFSVLNLLIQPSNYHELPFFGADFVTLPKGHLLALDLQPALKFDSLHTQVVWPRLLSIHKYWQSVLPSGGAIPTEAQSFFSPGFLWSRLPLSKESDTMISDFLKPAFAEYLALYIDLIKNSEAVSKERALKILEGQKNYINYRSTKDPARAMLTRLYGNDWTETYINEVLFNV